MREMCVEACTSKHVKQIWWSPPTVKPQLTLCLWTHINSSAAQPVRFHSPKHPPRLTPVRCRRGGRVGRGLPGLSAPGWWQIHWGQWVSRWGLHWLCLFWYFQSNWRLGSWEAGALSPFTYRMGGFLEGNTIHLHACRLFTGTLHLAQMFPHRSPNHWGDGVICCFILPFFNIGERRCICCAQIARH